MTAPARLWKIDPVSAGTAYGTLDAMTGYLQSIRQAIQEGRTAHAIELTNLAEAHTHMTLAKVSADLPARSDG